eukprot:2198636-Prymnesium_polylepis.1
MRRSNTRPALLASSMNLPAPEKTVSTFAAADRLQPTSATRYTAYSCSEAAARACGRPRMRAPSPVWSNHCLTSGGSFFFATCSGPGRRRRRRQLVKVLFLGAAIVF